MRPFAGILTLTLGIMFLAWYVRGIRGAVVSDIHNFSSAFRESPSLTIFFLVMKVFAFVFFPCLFTVMIYVPLRNFFSARRQTKLSEEGKGQLPFRRRCELLKRLLTSLEGLR